MPTLISISLRPEVLLIASSTLVGNSTSPTADLIIKSASALINSSIDFCSIFTFDFSTFLSNFNSNTTFLVFNFAISSIIFFTNDSVIVPSTCPFENKDGITIVGINTTSSIGFGSGSLSLPFILFGT